MVRADVPEGCHFCISIAFCTSIAILDQIFVFRLPFWVVKIRVVVEGGSACVRKWRSVTELEATKFFLKLQSFF